MPKFDRPLHRDILYLGIVMALVALAGYGWKYYKYRHGNLGMTEWSSYTNIVTYCVTFSYGVYGHYPKTIADFMKIGDEEGVELRDHFVDLRSQTAELPSPYYWTYLGPTFEAPDQTGTVYLLIVTNTEYVNERCDIYSIKEGHDVLVNSGWTTLPMQGDTVDTIKLSPDHI